MDSQIVRVSATTYALIKLRSIQNGRTLKETTERLISVGLEEEKQTPVKKGK